MGDPSRNDDDVVWLAQTELCGVAEGIVVCRVSGRLVGFSEKTVKDRRPRGGRTDIAVPRAVATRLGLLPEREKLS